MSEWPLLYQPSTYTETEALARRLAAADVIVRRVEVPGATPRDPLRCEVRVRIGDLAKAENVLEDFLASREPVVHPGLNQRRLWVAGALVLAGLILVFALA